MTKSKKSKNTWVLILCGVVDLLLTGGIVALDSLSAPLDGVIRAGALMGYLGVFLAALSSNYMRELTRFFGRSFIKVHHIVSVTALVALIVHAVGVAWRSGSASAFLPSFASWRLFFALGGRPAFWLLAVTSLTALFRTTIGKNWKVIHWLNYIAFALGTIHAQMIGTSFVHLGLRIVAWVMLAVLIGVFVWKRTRKRRALAKAKAGGKR
ncbi:MAG: ferric reductase-like transmembrane domain-containing protein [Anaerolineae bacterium]|nr:ferric reductase-like transmembrane domain-containing protein [Anaerolineae bacterium]